MPHKIASQWKMEGKKIGTWRERRTNKTYRREQKHGNPRKGKNKTVNSLSTKATSIQRQN